MTDSLARSLGADLCVRFNGGAQAGHNVVTDDGRHHTFAQLGAASFLPSVRTHLASPVVVHPTALAIEADRLSASGVRGALERVSVDARCLVVTPFHQAANRLREIARGDARHGSCGAGVGETVADAIADADGVVRVRHLQDRAELRRRLSLLAARKRAELASVLSGARGEPGADVERRIFDDSGIADRWIDAACAVAARVAVVDEAWLAGALGASRGVVFEGAQGVLLDEWAGFHPHTTYSTCTFANALAILREARFDRPVTRVGVLRTYLVRHGSGPFPTEDPALTTALPELHNEEGPWQGRVRRGWPDAILARYAARAAGGVDVIALTHLDALPRLPAWKTCARYALPGWQPDLFAGEGDFVDSVHPPVGHDLERQARLCADLGRATPVLEPAGFLGEGGERRAVAFFEEAVGAPVRFVSRGPRASDVRGVLSGR